MKPEPSLTVISLGGGVQSSVMALMANEGAFDRIPDCAIFADTRWEPPSIYEHLEWLAGQLRFPLYVVDNGRSLREDVKALTNHSGSRNYVDIPVYLKGRDGEGDGIGRRQCTDNYKIRPIRRRIRGLLGLRPRQRVPAGTTPCESHWLRRSRWTRRNWERTDRETASATSARGTVASERGGGSTPGALTMTLQ